MKELHNFREYLNEADFKVGDKVTMKAGGDEMEITKARRMFGSKVNAYTVKKSDGETAEYDESQLKLAEGMINESAPGYDTRKSGEPLPTLESVKAPTINYICAIMFHSKNSPSSMLFCQRPIPIQARS